MQRHRNNLILNYSLVIFAGDVAISVGVWQGFFFIMKALLTEFENRYSISDLGKIVYIKKNNPVKAFVNNRGYLVFRRAGYGGFSVHRLVAKYFIPNPDNKSDVNHIDGNKLNNSASNLEWISHAGNMSHAQENKLIPQYKLNKEKNQQIVALLNIGKKAKEVAAMFGVSVVTIYNVKKASKKA